MAGLENQLGCVYYRIDSLNCGRVSTSRSIERGDQRIWEGKTYVESLDFSKEGRDRRGSYTCAGR